ncbi:RNase P/RNase MRP subunit POP5 [Rhodanobacter sp. A1T4]|nr:RNase P/RNase MRP subunit POP5 [Rhodanobacter sp. A1T4]
MTAADHADWQVWRKARKLAQQRESRKLYPRIDYYPSDEALRIIGAQRGDYSRVIDALVLIAAGELPE